jgi:hypothetical protein
MTNSPCASSTCEFWEGANSGTASRKRRSAEPKVSLNFDTEISFSTKNF